MRRSLPHPRRHVALAVLVCLALLATAPLPAAAGDITYGAPPDPVADATLVHRLVFDVPLDVFNGVASSHLDGDTWFDWSTDWCTAPLVGSTGRSFDFRIPCRRHDFAYRNTKLLDVRYGCTPRPAGTVCAPGTWRYGRFWNPTSRLAIDQQLRRDMRSTCWARAVWDWPKCLAWAEVFYRAVRAAGGP